MTSPKKKRIFIGCFIPDQLEVAKLGQSWIILHSLQKVRAVSEGRAPYLSDAITRNLVNVLIEIDLFTSRLTPTILAKMCGTLWLLCGIPAIFAPSPSMLDDYSGSLSFRTTLHGGGGR